MNAFNYIIEIFAAIQIAVIAWVYVFILTDNDNILSGWSAWLHRRTESEWILKPLVDCEYCVAGQIALWSFPFLFAYDPIHHIVFIINSIFAVKILNICLNS